MRRILCLYLPDWHLQRLRVEREVQSSEFKVPSRGSAGSSHSIIPLILHARDPRRGEMVVICDAAAAARGVRPGMPLAEAAALASHDSAASGGVQILPHDPAADLAALAKLALHCERFSPLVGWQTAEGGAASSGKSRQSGGWSRLGPDCLLLDVTGIGVLFGGEEMLVRAAVADLAKLGYRSLASVAPTIGAAWAAAAFAAADEKGLGVDCGCGFASGMTLSQSIPDPLALALPIEALRLAPETVALLAQLGIERIEQLLALPRTSLRARFGERLNLRIDQWLKTDRRNSPGAWG